MKKFKLSPKNYDSSKACDFAMNAHRKKLETIKNRDFDKKKLTVFKIKNRKHTISGI